MIIFTGFPSRCPSIAIMLGEFGTVSPNPEHAMKLLVESTRSMSLLVLFNMDGFLVPLLIIAALFLAGALLDYATEF